MYVKQLLQARLCVLIINRLNPFSLFYRLLPSIACSGFAGGIGRGDALDVENILDERSAGENKTVDVLVYGLVGFLSLLLLVFIQQ